MFMYIGVVILDFKFDYDIEENILKIYNMSKFDFTSIHAPVKYEVEEVDNIDF